MHAGDVVVIEKEDSVFYGCKGVVALVDSYMVEVEFPHLKVLGHFRPNEVREIVERRFDCGPIGLGNG